jgi:hypothetical protein
MYNAIVVVGNGKTSRANVEALIDDYIYANPKLELFFYLKDKLSEGQVWLKQYAQDKDILFKEDSLLPTDKDSAFFILWDDEDPACALALATAQNHDIPAFDLTNGLVQLSSPNKLEIQEPSIIPVQEQLPIDVDEEIVSPITIDDEDDNEETYEDPLYEAIRIVAEIFAETLAKEIVKAMKS